LTKGNIWSRRLEGFQIRSMATSRLKTAADSVAVGWLIAAFDGEVLHLVPELPER